MIDGSTTADLNANRLRLWGGVVASGILLGLLVVGNFSGREAERRRNLELQQLLRLCDAHQRAIAEWSSPYMEATAIPAPLAVSQSLQQRFEQSAEKLFEPLRKASEAGELGPERLSEMVRASERLKSEVLNAALAKQEHAPGLTTDYAVTIVEARRDIFDALSRARIDLLDRHLAVQQLNHSWQVLRDIALLVGLTILLLGLVVPLIRAIEIKRHTLEQQAAELRRLALVARSTNNSVMITDPEGRLSWVNEAFTHLSGYRIDEVIGKFPSELVQFEATSGSTKEVIRDAMKRRRTVQVEILNRSKKGREYWIALEIQPLYDANRKITGFLGVAAEITDEVRLRSRLTESENRLVAATDAAELGLWDWFPSTDEAWFNRTWWSMLDFPNEAGPSTGSAFFELIHPDDKEVVNRALQRHLAGEASEYRVEFRMRTLIGYWRWIRATGRIAGIDAQGKPIRISGIHQNIQTTKLAEEAINESERRLTKIAENVPGVIFQLRMTPDGHVTTPYLSSAAVDFFGHSAEAIRNDSRLLFDAFSDEDCDRVRSTLERSAQGLNSFQTDIRTVDETGRLRWIEMSGVPELECDGSVLWHGYLQEVTERHDAQAELARREEELRTVLTNSPGVAYRCSADDSWSMVFLAEGIQSLTGYPASDFVNHQVRTFASVVHEDDADAVDQVVRAGIDRHERWSVEYRIRHANGTERWVLEQGEASYDAHDRATFIDGFLVDVTALKQAESEAQRWRKLASAIIESALDGVLSVDALGRIVGWNSRAIELFGFEPQQARELTLRDLIQPPSNDPSVSSSPLVVAQGERIETLGTSRSGIQFPVEVSISQANIEGELVHSVFVRDISDVVRNRTELLAARSQAESASRAKTDFLANMSHEIRTPMTAILGYADLLFEDDSTQPDLIRRQQALDSIRRNGRHLLAVINDILDLSKIEAGKMIVDRRELNVLPLSRDVIDLLMIRAREKNISLRLVSPPEIPPVLFGDEVRLRQILMNMVGNAIKFTDQGGVSLELGTSVDPSGNPWFEFRVVDSGIGMAPEQVRQLFQPFCQVDSSMTRRHGGTGLGLTISRRLAEHLGGTLDVESQPDVGSTFTLRLPLTNEQSQTLVNVAERLELSCPLRESLDATDPQGDSSQTNVAYAMSGARLPSTAANPSSPLEGLKILLAEDGPDNQRFISLILSKAGAKVEIAENGRVACRRLLGVDPLCDMLNRTDQSESLLESTHPGVGDRLANDQAESFDLVLMDMQMPEMDGYSATSHLRVAGCRVPIIALTAHAMSGDRERCMAAGCDDYATKPIDRIALISLCEKLGHRHGLVT